MRYEIKRYYSTFYTLELEAESEDEAYQIAKDKLWDEQDKYELLANLDEWSEADEISKMSE
jgi:hypothetical protein